MRVHAIRATLLVALLAGTAAASTNVFDMPRLYGRHLQLVQQMRQNLRDGDAAAMEITCRAGLALLPDDPTWHYNLACAFARQQRVAAALDTLARAVELGFRNAESMRGDADLAALRGEVRFTDLVERTRALKNTPPSGLPLVRPSTVGEQALVTATNTLWNFEMGHFYTRFAFPAATPPSTNPAVHPAWPAGGALRRWLDEGTAAGFRGMLYDNRDRGHSALDRQLFPALAPVAYVDDIRQRNLDVGLTPFLFEGAVVVGNASTAQTQGPFWRSNPRMAYVDGRALGFLVMQYISNQLYIYPAHRDYDPAVQGDLFPAITPYLLITRGSSGSDQPFVQAVAATLAAFRPEVRTLLARQGMLMPTVQMLLRASQKGVVARADYLTPRAHPAVFEAAALDLPRLLALAQALQTNALPPQLTLRPVAESPARPGRDFFDAAVSERLFDSPCAIARVLRGTARRHTLTVDARAARDPQGRPLTWHWVLLRGDPAKVTITPRDATGSSAEIAVDYHGGRFAVTNANGSVIESSRVDIGVFVDNGSHYSAPAFVSFLHLNNEQRTYAPDGRILTVDYAASADRYTDPFISLTRTWRDVYRYDPANRPIGWTRLRGDQTESFTADGARVETHDARGRALTARLVRYLPRSPTGATDEAPELIQIDGDTLLRYRYTGDDDWVGSVAVEPAVKP